METLFQKTDPGLHSYGWVRDHPDHRDKFFAPRIDVTALPPAVDLRPQCPPVYDQGQLGSCALNAASALIEFDEKKQAETDVMPSRLYLYYNVRYLENSIRYDSGCQIRDVMKALANWGYCPEVMWPYVISQFKKRPPNQCYADGGKHRITSYSRVPQDLNSIKTVLSQGFPIEFGFSVYQNFESPEVAHTGIVPMPSGSVLGGHAVTIVGYDDAKSLFTVRNSWSAGWGDKGYCYFPYAMVVDAHISSDFWVVNAVP